MKIKKKVLENKDLELVELETYCQHSEDEIKNVKALFLTRYEEFALVVGELKWCRDWHRSRKMSDKNVKVTKWLDEHPNVCILGVHQFLNRSLLALL